MYEGFQASIDFEIEKLNINWGNGVKFNEKN